MKKKWKVRAWKKMYRTYLNKTGGQENGKNDLSGQCGNNKNSPGSCRGYAPYFSEYYGNPSSIYAIAGKSKEAITKGREQIANVLGAKPEEIYFTAGGSESDNWALKATFEAYKIKETTSSPQNRASCDSSYSRVS